MEDEAQLSAVNVARVVEIFLGEQQRVVRLVAEKGAAAAERGQHVNVLRRLRAGGARRCHGNRRKKDREQGSAHASSRLRPAGAIAGRASPAWQGVAARL